MLQLILSIPGELISVVLLSSAHRSRLISQSFCHITVINYGHVHKVTFESKKPENKTLFHYDIGASTSVHVKAVRTLSMQV